MTQPSSPLPPDEPISGRAAAAVANMHGELERNFTGLNLAEVRLAQVLLNAHAISVSGRQRLDDIARQLIAAIDNPLDALDTPAGQRQFLLFLRSKISEIQQILAEDSLSAEDQAALTRALADDYLARDAPAGASSAIGAGQPAGAAVGPASGLTSALPPAVGALPQAAGLGQQAGGSNAGAGGSPLAALPGGLSSLLAGGSAADSTNPHEGPGGRPDTRDNMHRDAESDTTSDSRHRSDDDDRSDDDPPDDDPPDDDPPDDDGDRRVDDPTGEDEPAPTGPAGG